MNEYREQLSALIDGELSDDESRRLQPELEAATFSTASRYQMIAAAMRSAQDDADMIDISDQVRVAILQEQTFKPETASAGLTASKHRPGFLSWRLAGGATLAASVALVLVSVVTNNGIQSPGNNPIVASESVNQPAQQTLTASMQSMPQHYGMPVNDEVRQNLNSYLNAHSEFAAQDTAQGRMPYARAVAYETVR